MGFRIEIHTLWHGRDGTAPTWFHPRACTLPGQVGARVLMTLQEITGSDIFHPVHATESADGGRTWTEPEAIPAFGAERLPDGTDNAVCDVVPEYHPPTGTILAMGHNVYYRDGRLVRPAEGRYPVYSVRSARGGPWSERRRIAWDDPRATAIFTSNCGQRVTLPDGHILVPVSFGPLGRTDRAAGSLLCTFDGEAVRVAAATRRELRLAAGRGLLEPSLVRWADGVLMTVRAEDGRGYVSRSADGLEWEPLTPWAFDDGERLTMSSTQQHWLKREGKLFLVYTRKSDINPTVMRWRAPIYLAQVDPASLLLVRATEQIVLPLLGDGIRDGENVARMGNFHPLEFSAEESWVTVGETMPGNGWRGNTLLARIRSGG